MVLNQENRVSHEVHAWPARLRFDPTAFIAPGAVVTGDVTLGARVSVWFGTVIRGDSDRVQVGDDTNLQDLTLVHQDEGYPARIGSRVTVGHRAILHGCTIEDDCLIGMGAVLLSGARIGAGSLVAAGALVKEGQEIPPGSLVVGAPARVLGPVKAVHQEAIRNGAAHYAALGQSFLRRGFARPHPRPDADTGTAVPWRGPMTFDEWRRALVTLDSNLDAVTGWCASHDQTAWRRSPGAGRWSALEVLAHLRDTDAEVQRPRIGRILAESEPTIEGVDAPAWASERGYATQDRDAALAAWRTTRTELIATLAPLGPADWRKLAWHSARGPFPLAELVRDWVEHDLLHRRQIALALGERP
jgi:carbonic anhydrase/acetyltransferase-like protein (isoleucine patch superfamily)